MFVAVDIGCIECGEATTVLGIFTKEGDAKAACDRAEAIQQQDWRGSHSFEVFDVPTRNQFIAPEYMKAEV